MNHNEKDFTNDLKLTELQQSNYVTLAMYIFLSGQSVIVSDFHTYSSHILKYFFKNINVFTWFLRWLFWRLSWQLFHTE